MPRTYYLWDEVNDTLLEETDEAGNRIAQYTHEPGQFGPLLSQRRNGHTYYHHYDGQGSTRALTDETGNVTDTAIYTAFGEPVASSGTTMNPFGYKGALGYYVNPETNDLYVRARTYQPVIARWWSLEPNLSIRWRDAYRYSGNSPSMLADPSGAVAVAEGGDPPRITDEERRILDKCKCEIREFDKPLREILKEGQAKAATICRGGEPSFILGHPEDIADYETLKKCDLLACIEEHERHHVSQLTYRCKDVCKGRTTGDRKCSFPVFAGQAGVLTCNDATECHPTQTSLRCGLQKYRKFKESGNEECKTQAGWFIWESFRYYLFKYRCVHLLGPGNGEDWREIAEIYDRFDGRPAKGRPDRLRDF